MLNPFDVAGAIEKAVTDLIALHKIDLWARLVFTMGFSGVTSFLVIAGGALTAHRPGLEAIGEGMCSAAVAMTILFRRSPLTKGMMVALPAEEAKTEIESNTQVIQK